MPFLGQDTQFHYGKTNNNNNDKKQILVNSVQLQYDEGELNL